MEDVVLAHLRPELLPVDGEDLIGDVVDATVAVLVDLPGRGRKEPIVCRDLLVGPAREELGSVYIGFAVGQRILHQDAEWRSSTRFDSPKPHILMLRRREITGIFSWDRVKNRIKVKGVLAKWPIDRFILHMLGNKSLGMPGYCSAANVPTPTDLGWITAE